MKYNMIVCNFEKGLISFGTCHAVGTPASCWVSSVRVGSERYVQLKRTMLCSCHCLMFVCQLLMYFSFQTILYISIIYDDWWSFDACRYSLINSLFVYLIFGIFWFSSSDCICFEARQHWRQEDRSSRITSTYIIII